MAATTPDDAALLVAWARDRDEAAFTALWERHGPAVHAACRRLAEDPAMAEDAAQAVAIVLARRAGSVRDGGRLAAWLHRCAARAVADARRAARRRARHEAAAPAPSPPAADAAWQDARPVLDACLARLTPAQREAVLRCYLGGRTQAEAAAEIGVSVPALKMRLQAGLARLRRLLERRGVGLGSAALAAGLAREAGAAVAPAAGPSAIALATAQRMILRMFVLRCATAAAIVLAPAAGALGWAAVAADAPRPAAEVPLADAPRRGEGQPPADPPPAPADAAVGGGCFTVATTAGPQFVAVRSITHGGERHFDHPKDPRPIVQQLVYWRSPDAAPLATMALQSEAPDEPGRPWTLVPIAADAELVLLAQTDPGRERALAVAGRWQSTLQLPVTVLARLPPAAEPAVPVQAAVGPEAPAGHAAVLDRASGRVLVVDLRGERVVATSELPADLAADATPCWSGGWLVAVGAQGLCGVWPAEAAGRRAPLPRPATAVRVIPGALSDPAPAAAAGGTSIPLRRYAVLTLDGLPVALDLRASLDLGKPQGTALDDLRAQAGDLLVVDETHDEAIRVRAQRTPPALTGAEIRSRRRLGVDAVDRRIDLEDAASRASLASLPAPDPRAPPGSRLRPRHELHLLAAAGGWMVALIAAKGPDGAVGAVVRIERGRGAGWVRNPDTARVEILGEVLRWRGSARVPPAVIAPDGSAVALRDGDGWRVVAAMPSSGGGAEEQAKAKAEAAPEAAPLKPGAPARSDAEGSAQAGAEASAKAQAEARARADAALAAPVTVQWRGLRLSAALGELAARTRLRTMRVDPLLAALQIDLAAQGLPLSQVLDRLFSGAAWAVEDGVVHVWGPRGRPAEWLSIMPTQPAPPRPIRPRPEQPKPETPVPPAGASDF